MLLARRALAEPSVIGDVEQNFRAACHEFAHEPREHALVADERADLVGADRRNHHAASSREVAELRRNLIRKPERPRHELAERHQVHLVVPAARHRGPYTGRGAAEFGGAPPGVWATMPSSTCAFAVRARLST